MKNSDMPLRIWLRNVTTITEDIVLGLNSTDSVRIAYYLSQCMT